MTHRKSSDRTTLQAASIDNQEIDKFARMADEWWDINGKFKPLHQINPVRLQYIKDELISHFNLTNNALHPFKGLKILDIGCGGGLLCEPMARLGASITGVDVAQDSIMVAKQHAQDHGLMIDYRCISAEELVELGESYDVVLNMEVVEHVADVAAFIKTSASLIAPKGIMLMSTLNRTLKSFALGVVAAEYILKWLPKGTHHWEKFITPAELKTMVENAGLKASKPKGIVYNPMTDSWAQSYDTSINYMLSARRD